MDKITYKVAVRLALDQILSEEPDHIYELTGACVYVSSDGEASCLIGRMLHAHGVPLSLLAEYNHTALNSRSPELPAALGLEVTAKAFAFMASLQKDQDVGETWAWSFVNAVGQAWTS